MNIIGVEAEIVQGIWPFVQPMIKFVTDQNGQDPEKIFTALLDKKAQMVIAHDGHSIAGVLLTELPIIAGRQVCNIWLVAGRDRDKWFHELEGLERWAKEKGCAAIRCTDSRIGWKRILGPLGYKVKRLTLEKEL